MNIQTSIHQLFLGIVAGCQAFDEPIAMWSY